MNALEDAKLRARLAHQAGHTQARFADVNWTAVCVRTVTDLCLTVTDR